MKKITKKKKFVLMLMIVLSVSFVWCFEYQTKNMTAIEILRMENIEALTNGENIFPITGSCGSIIVQMCSRDCPQCGSVWTPAVVYPGPAYNVSGKCDCGNIFIN